MVVVFTKQERDLLVTTLEFEWIRRDIGMASDDEVAEKDTLTSVIKKLGRVIKFAKKQGFVKYE